MAGTRCCRLRGSHACGRDRRPPHARPVADVSLADPHGALLPRVRVAARRELADQVRFCGRFRHEPDGVFCNSGAHLLMGQMVALNDHGETAWPGSTDVSLGYLAAVVAYGILRNIPYFAPWLAPGA